MEENKVKLYRYPQKTNVKTSFDIGELTPGYWTILNPGESIKNLSVESLTRMITPIHPTLDVAKIKLYAFACPIRFIEPSDYSDLYKDVKHYYFDNNVLAHLNDEVTEGDGSFLFQPGTINPNSSLLKKFGLPDNKDVLLNMSKIDSTYNFNYLLAYHKIYYDFFKSKRIENADFSEFKHYFNKILSSKDLTVIKYPDEADADVFDKYFWGGFNKLHLNNINNDVINMLSINNISNNLNNSWSGALWNMFNDYVTNVKNLEHINYGTQKDLILKIWNKTNGDKTNVELIGFTEWYQQIEQVTNTAKNNGQALGEVGGMSVVYNKDVLITNYVANEPTIVMVIISPEYNTELIDFVDAYQWVVDFDSDAFDFVEYNPNQLNILRPFKLSNFWTTKSDNGEIIAYSRPFNFLQKQYNVVAGDVRDKWASWTYNRTLYNPEGQPSMALKVTDFKTIKAPFKNTLVSPTQDAFIAEFNFSGEFMRAYEPDYVLKDKALKGE